MRVSNQNIGNNNFASKSSSVPQSLPVDKPRLTIAIKSFKEKVLEWLSYSTGVDTNHTNYQKKKLLQLLEQMHKSLNSWNSSSENYNFSPAKHLGTQKKDYLFLFS